MCLDVSTTTGPNDRTLVKVRDLMSSLPRRKDFLVLGLNKFVGKRWGSTSLTESSVIF